MHWGLTVQLASWQVLRREIITGSGCPKRAMRAQPWMTKQLGICQSLRRGRGTGASIPANPRGDSATWHTECAVKSWRVEVKWRLEKLVNSYRNFAWAQVHTWHRQKPKYISLWIYDKSRMGEKSVIFFTWFCADDHIPWVHPGVCRRRPLWTGHTS